VITVSTPSRTRIDPTLLARAFRTVAIAEACSWTGLLIGMVFKYLVVFDDVGVKIFGPIHGVLFILYVIITLVTARTFRWRAGTTIVGLLASIPPLTTLWFEHSAHRRGLIDGERLRHG
jgi:integral membrane protein